MKAFFISLSEINKAMHRIINEDQGTTSEQAFLIALHRLGGSSKYFVFAPYHIVATFKHVDTCSYEYHPITTGVFLTDSMTEYELFLYVIGVRDNQQH